MNLRALFVFVFALVATQLSAQEYRITVESEGEGVAVIELSINDEMAVAKIGDLTEHFDLTENRWRHDESKIWVTLSQCESWALKSKEKSNNSTAEVPENIRSFVQWCLEPTFDVVENDSTLTLTSGQVDYKVIGEAADYDLTNYFRYARLNAYKKAMTLRKLPPYAELRVIDELEQRKLLPRSMEIKIPGVPGSPMIKMLIAPKGV